jgi:hypothetical protein
MSDTWMVRLPWTLCNNALSRSPFAKLALQFTIWYIKNIAGGAEMPDAMEIIYKEALEVGTSGAVSK